MEAIVEAEATANIRYDGAPPNGNVRYKIYDEKECGMLDGGKVVLDPRRNTIDFMRTMHYRIHKHRHHYELETLVEKRKEMICWAIGLILMDEFYDTPEQLEVAIYKDAIVERGELMLLGAVDRSDITSSFEAAKRILNSGHSKVIRANYADALIISSIYRKHNGNTYCEWVYSYGDTPKVFPGLKEGCVSEDMKYYLCDICSFMNKCLTNDSLYSHAALYSGKCALGNSSPLTSVGGSASPKFGEISVSLLCAEHKFFENMAISIVEHSLNVLEKEGYGPFINMKALLLAYEGSENELTKIMGTMTGYWWSNLVKIANNVRINSVFDVEHDSAVRAASVLYAWWTRTQVFTNTRFNYKSCKSALISTAAATYFISRNANTSDITYLFEEHEHDYGKYPCTELLSTQDDE